MEEELERVSYGQAKILYKLGFPKDVTGVYYSMENYFTNIHTKDEYIVKEGDKIDDAWTEILEHCDAPYLAQAEKWILKNYKLFIHIDLNFQTTQYKCEVCKFNGMTCYIGEFDSKENALKKGLDKCFEIIQDDFNK